MSIEERIGELIASNAAVVAALATNSSLLERVVAGQAAAMEKLEGAKPATTRTRKAKDETPPGNEKPADTAPGADDVGSASESAATGSPIAGILAEIGTDADKLKAYVSAWTGGTEDQAERAKRVDLLKAIAANFGVNPKFSELIPHVKETVFFIERSKAGQSVDFNAEYDFDGDPAQGATAPAATSDDDFG